MIFGSFFIEKSMFDNRKKTNRYSEMDINNDGLPLVIKKGNRYEVHACLTNWLICILKEDASLIIAVVSCFDCKHFILLKRESKKTEKVTQIFFLPFLFKPFYSIKCPFFRWKEINVAYHNMHELAAEAENKNKALE